MVWRWVSRGVCMALLAVCVGAWVGSYFAAMGVYHVGPRWVKRVSVIKGRLGFYATNDGPNLGLGWHRYYDRYIKARSASEEHFYGMSTYHLAGFALNPGGSMINPLEVRVPLWFPTLLSAGLLGVVWRKARGKYDGKGFPVEVGGGNRK